VRGLQDPASIDRESDVLIDRIRERVSASQESSALLSDAHGLDADAARKWRDHPAQYWLERAITMGSRRVAVRPKRGGCLVDSLGRRQ
jgi:hypothetical protein